MRWDLFVALVALAAAALSALTKAERRAAAATNAIGYLPCEHCGEHVFTALREPTAGETIRLCTKCGINLPAARRPQ